MCAWHCIQHRPALTCNTDIATPDTTMIPAAWHRVFTALETLPFTCHIIQAKEEDMSPPRAKQNTTPAAVTSTTLAYQQAANVSGLQSAYSFGRCTLPHR